MYNWRGDLFLYCKEPHKIANKKIYGEYIIEAKIQNKMRFDKFNAYTEKETLGCREGNLYMAAARGAAKRGKPERDKRRNKSINK